VFKFIVAILDTCLLCLIYSCGFVHLQMLHEKVDRYVRLGYLRVIVIFTFCILFVAAAGSLSHLFDIAQINLKSALKFIYRENLYFIQCSPELWFLSKQLCFGRLFLFEAVSWENIAYRCQVQSLLCFNLTIILNSPSALGQRCLGSGNYSLDLLNNSQEISVFCCYLL
jgi:hypothetical protein